MEDLSLRDMIFDEVEYRGLDEEIVGKAVKYVLGSSRLMEMLDMVVSDAISHCE